MFGQLSQFAFEVPEGDTNPYGKNNFFTKFCNSHHKAQALLYLFTDLYLLMAKTEFCTNF